MDNNPIPMSRPLGELIDLISILQIKQIMDPVSARQYEQELALCERELHAVVEAWGIDASRDTRFLRLTVALSQVNLHIWRTKDVMQMKPESFQESMKLAHQLNGLRNQAKNSLSSWDATLSRGPLRTNVQTDCLAGWRFSILNADVSEPVPASTRAEVVPSASAPGTTADLIDQITVLQIKESLLPSPEQAACTKELVRLSRDLQWRLAGSGKPVPSPLVRLVIFLAQVNLHVWYLKDRMKEEPQRYGDLLAFAQDLNSLRNVCRNTIMDLLGEGNLSQHHTFFFRDEGGAWYRPLIQWMGLLRNSTVISLSPEEFAGMFGIPPEEFDNTWKARVRDAGLRYQRLTPDYRDHIIRRIIHRIDSDQMWVSGPDKVGVWEKGWKENLLEYQKTGDLNALTPKFVQSAPVLRLGGDYIKPLNPDFEFVAVDIFRRWLFKRFLSEASAIYEFGCGSCQHLPVLAEMFPGRTLYALDWAASSCDIAEALATAHGWKIKGIRFNLFAPDTHLEMEPNTAVLTVGALEQLGENFEPFLNFLLKQRPRMVVHVETLQELYDSEKLSDYLALKHDTKRNYLHGYLTALRRLAGEGRVQLLRVQRSSFGSMYHDSYSSVAWRPS